MKEGQSPEYTPFSSPDVRGIFDALVDYHAPRDLAKNAEPQSIIEAQLKKQQGLNTLVDFYRKEYYQDYQLQLDSLRQERKTSAEIEDMIVDYFKQRQDVIKYAKSTLEESPQMLAYNAYKAVYGHEELFDDTPFACEETEDTDDLLGAFFDAEPPLSNHEEETTRANLAYIKNELDSINQNGAVETDHLALANDILTGLHMIGLTGGENPNKPLNIDLQNTTTRNGLALLGLLIQRHSALQGLSVEQIMELMQKDEAFRIKVIGHYLLTLQTIRITHPDEPSS